MRRRTRLLWLYPQSWRVRYGDEFDALIEDLGASPRLWMDVLLAALRIRFRGVTARQAAVTPSGTIGALEPHDGGSGMLAGPFFALAAIAALSAIVLFLLHSFAYVLVLIFAALFALAGGIASVIGVRRRL